MRFKSFLVLLVALMLGGTVLGLFWNVTRGTGAAQTPAEQRSTGPARRLDAPNITFIDQAIGPKDAQVTIVEFGDYLCPYCRTSEATVQRVLKEQPERVRFVWKDMPAPIHAGAGVAAEAGLCAAKQGDFWSFHQALFDHAGSYDETSMAFLASQQNLDTQAFTDCLSAHETRPLVERTVDEGLALGVDALPTFFINGKKHVGTLTYEALLDAMR